MIFCDTSYAAKLYVPEADSETVRKHLEDYPSEVCLSELARAELLGVFHRSHRPARSRAPQISARLRLVLPLIQWGFRDSSFLSPDFLQ